jgi:hypothetical protein
MIPAPTQNNSTNVNDAHHLRLFSSHDSSLQGWIQVELPNLDVATAFLAFAPYLGLNVQLMK